MTVIPQHLQALAAANEIRLARAGLRRDVHAGRATIADALGAHCAQSMTVIDLLMCQHRWGRERALRALAHLGLRSERRRVSDLTERQRGLLLLALGLTTDGDDK
jgi:hypothetical protein